MVRELVQVLDLLLAVEHLPALDAEDLSVRFRLDGVQTLDERHPLWRVSPDHI